MSDKKYEDGPVQLPVGTIVSADWKVMKKLGEGGCGAVYMVESMKDGRRAALKAESNFVEGGSVLKLEVDILTKLKGKKHVPEIIHAGKKERYQYMVMSLLGEPLCDLLKACGRQLTISSQLRLGIHVLHGLKQIHDAGFVHRDIKPANLALGNREGGTDPNFIYVLDFGLSRSFVVEEEGVLVLRKPRKHALFRGTTRYCSAEANEKRDQCRADDLWSLLYVMIELRGKLPWASLTDKKDLAATKRSSEQDRTLFEKCPHQLKDFAAHLRKWDYWTRPDYVVLYKTLMEAMAEGGYKFSDPWDWQLKTGKEGSSKMLKTGKDASSKGLAKIESSQKGSKSLSLKRSRSSGAGKKSMASETPDERPPFTEDDFASNPLGF